MSEEQVQDQTQAKPQKEEKLLVCIGVRLSKENKVATFWQRIEGEECRYSLSSKRLYGFTKPLVKGAYPGSIYRASVTLTAEEDITVWGTPSYVGRYDGPELAEWETLHKATQAQAQAESNRKKDASYDALREHLKPIKEAMAKTNINGRRAIIAVVLDELYR